jgi:hypothetical protein
MVMLVVTLTVVLLGASACFGGSTSRGTAPIRASDVTTRAQPGAFTIRVKLNPCTPAMWGQCRPVSHHYSLRPGWWNDADPDVACAAIADYESYLKAVTGPWQSPLTLPQCRTACDGRSALGC